MQHYLIGSFFEHKYNRNTGLCNDYIIARVLLMLRMSKMSDYGTIIMSYLARQRPGVLKSAVEIATATHLGTPTVSKILKRLLHADLLISERGVKGGYRLKHTPLDISLADIINALEDRLGITECSDGSTDCAMRCYCDNQANWQVINQTIKDALNSISLKILSEPVEEATKPLTFIDSRKEEKA